MIFSPILALPDPDKFGSIKRRTGSGTVLVDPQTQTLTIKTTTDQITAKYQDSSIQSGDSVHYTLLNDILLIEKIPEQDQMIETDSYVRQQPAELNKVSMMLDSLISKITQEYSNDQLKQDIYSIIESISALSAAPDQKMIENISSLLLKMDNLKSDSIEKLKELLLQLKHSIVNQQPFQSKFIELPLNNIPQAIYKYEAVNSLFNSSQPHQDALLQTMDIMKEHNFQYLRIIPCAEMSLAKLIGSEDLVHELKSLTDSFKSPQMKSIPVSALQTVINNRNELNLEVLNSIDDFFTITTQTLSRRPGTEPSQSSTLTQWLLTSLDHQPILPELVNRYPATATSIVSMIKDNPVFKPGIDNFGITSELINTIQSKPDFIPSIIERLGYNFESNLLKSGIDKLHQASLKEIILAKYGSVMGTSLSTRSSDLSSLPLKDMYNQTSFPEFFKDVSELLGNLPVMIEPDQDIEKAVNSIHESFSRIAASDKKVDTDLAHSQLTDGIKNNDTEDKTSLVLNDKSVQLLSNLLKNINTFQNSLLSIRDSVSSDIFEHLMNLSEKAGRSIERLLCGNKEPSYGNVYSPRQSDQTSRPEQKELHDDKTALDSASIKDGLLYNHQQSRTAPDSLLNRFESLQLLSKLNSTSDGTQQILAIPVNVGGEWTELNIRLIKKESAKKKKDQKFYKVELNVAPSKLGSINVQMEYEIKKRFNLKIFFDKNQTLEWFSKNRNSLGKSISDLGLPLISFLIQSEMMKKSENEDSRLSSAGIDVKI